jgi:hypothetical protein
MLEPGGVAFARPLNFTVRRQMNSTVHRALGLIATTLVSSGVLASSADKACNIAYDDGSNVQEFNECKAGAVSGDAEAEFGYGLILWSGHDRQEDHAAALDWFRKSARQGHLLAQISLGTFLSHTDVEAPLRNPVEAYAWLVTANALDHASRLKDQFTRAQAAEAERLATEYRSKYAKH